MSCNRSCYITFWFIFAETELVVYLNRVLISVCTRSDGGLSESSFEGSRENSETPVAPIIVDDQVSSVCQPVGTFQQNISNKPGWRLLDLCESFTDAESLHW